MAGRTWLAVILCFMVWWSYTKFFMPPPPMPQQKIEQAQKTKDSSVSKESLDGTESSAVVSRGGLFISPSRSDITERFSENEMTIGFSEYGGRIVNVELLNYTKTIKKDSGSISPLNQENFPFSLATLFSEKALSDLSFGEYEMARSVRGAIFEKGAEGFKRVERDGAVQFVRTSPSGVRLIKQYWLSASGFEVDASYRFEFPEGNDRTDWGNLIIPVGGSGLEFDMRDPLLNWEVSALQDETLHMETIEGLEGDPPETFQGLTSWVAFGNRYFTTAIGSFSALNPDVVFLSKENFTGAYMRFPLLLSEGARELNFHFTTYVGPKDTKYLSAIPGMTRLVDYGWVSILAQPLLWLLKFFYTYVQNYGVAIILLTLLVRGAFFPLTAKSMKSMNEMKKLTPQLQALREKYKDDRDRLNKETMALYKTHKINPAAGCLPMLIQLPVFIALYQVLANAMELFHAPFFGWIQDLSTKDPYYIYPVLMGITMLIQQRMTPAAGMDPTQQKVMYIMPVVFTFIMLNLPSGLTLYIFVSTLLGILQQKAMKTSQPEKLAVVGSKGTAKG